MTIDPGRDRALEVIRDAAIARNEADRLEPRFLMTAVLARRLFEGYVVDDGFTKVNVYLDHVIPAPADITISVLRHRAAGAPDELIAILGERAIYPYWVPPAELNGAQGDVYRALRESGMDHGQAMAGSTAALAGLEE